MTGPVRHRAEYRQETWLTDQRSKCVRFLSALVRKQRVVDYGRPTLKIALLRDVMRRPADDPTVQQKAKDCLAQCLGCVKGRMGVECACQVFLTLPF